MHLPTMKSKRGYTLLELTIGTAVLFLLAIGTLILINPQQLMIEKRDAQRKKDITVIGEALISYAKSKNGQLPQGSNLWLSDLQVRGELPELPEDISYDTSNAVCKNNEQNGYCYSTDGKRPPTFAIVYTKLESLKENAKCNASLGETAYAVYDMLSVRGGVVCTIGMEPTYNSEGQQFKD